MRGPSAWSIAERELMAAMAAQWSACAFCTDMFGAAAARHYGQGGRSMLCCAITVQPRFQTD